VLEVSASGFYKWMSRKNSSRQEKELQMIEKIRVIHSESQGTYGSPRVFRQLGFDGIKVSKGKVERLMRIHRIQGKVKPRFRVTTNSNHSFQRFPNLVRRNFLTKQMNRVWVGDVTYIWSDEGWLYLAVVIDLYSRKVIGWSMDQKITAKLSVAALEMALLQRNPSQELIFHSDQGMEYACYDFRNFSLSKGITQSMSRKGNCWDNAVAESFFHTLKSEIRGEKYATRACARSRIFSWIEVFYNRQRIHSTLGYRSPVAYEEETAS